MQCTTSRKHIVKLGFTGVYFFFYSAQNIDCGYSLEPPRQGGSNNLCFEQKYENYHRFYLRNFQFLAVKFSLYLNRRVFVMKSSFFPQRQKTYLRTCAPANIQISLCILAVWSESELSAFWITEDAKLLHADNEDFDFSHRCANMSDFATQLYQNLY